jgi:hypothetical protein
MDEENLVGVIKIKDGLFICDEYGAQVSSYFQKYYFIGSRIHNFKQSC